MAFVVEIFLPLRDPHGQALPSELFEALQKRLVARFGGVTVFSRAPAEGLWRDGGKVDRDEVVIFEIMTEALDEPWWAQLRSELERDFRQQEVLMRASAVRRL